ncbi:MAG: hypothetical protein JWQ71_3441 [Pedosphaera sp.]|nr:hypothetical protein [Pedosphaera sp.]
MLINVVVTQEGGINISFILNEPASAGKIIRIYSAPIRWVR